MKNKRILFLTTRMPGKNYGGDRNRAWIIIKSLAKDNEITLFSFYEKDDELKLSKNLEKLCKKMYIFKLPKWRSYLNCIIGLFSKKPLQTWYYKSNKYQKKVDKEIKKHDVVLCHLIRTVEYVRNKKHIVKIHEMCDSLALNYFRAIKFQKDIMKYIKWLELSKLRTYEKEILKKFDKTILISKTDKDFIDKSNRKIEIITNYVNTDYFKPNEDYDQNKIVFLGKMDTDPNVDAVIYFKKKVFPLIKKRMPKAKFFIIGRNPTRRIYRLKERDIIIVGEVSDVRNYVANAAVFACFMRFGAGALTKLLESMAMGVPVVTTKEGVEGIEAKNENEICYTNNPKKFGEYCIRLMKNKKFRNKISKNALKFVETKFSKKVFEKTIEKL